MAHREPVSPGRFYPADPGLLRAQVAVCCLHPLGPGVVSRGGAQEHHRCDATASEVAAPRQVPLVLVVPHGALGHCGPVAAHAYARLRERLRASENAEPERVVILGPDHLGRGALVSATSLDYASPLGVLPTDQAAMQRLCIESATHSGPVRDAPIGHAGEHSVENQLPFLQHVLGDLASPRPVHDPSPGIQPAPSGAAAEGNLCRLVPLTMAAQDWTTASHLADLLDRTLPVSGVTLIATSDIAHCGLLYGNPCPERSVAGDLRQGCRRQLERTLLWIEGMSPEALIRARQAEQLSLCGVGCVATAMAFALRRGARSCRVLASADSVEVARGWQSLVPTDTQGQPLPAWTLLQSVDPDNPVGFAALILE
jgi:predicted class III extradiol MEMO1 family dioxygenase